MSVNILNQVSILYMTPDNNFTDFYAKMKFKSLTPSLYLEVGMDNGLGYLNGFIG